MTTKQVLQRARNHMAKWGKTEGQYFSNRHHPKACNVCVYGAMLAVTCTTRQLKVGVGVNVLNDPKHIIQDCEAELLETLGGLTDETDHAFGVIVKYSDRHSLEEVLDLFDRTIARLEETNNGN